MAKIVPAVLADTPQQYKADLERAAALSGRVQIDLVDGVFADNKTINLAQVYWQPDTQADVHLMYAEPAKQLELLISLAPHLVIVHAEAKGNLLSLLEQLKQVDIKVGVALLPETSVDSTTKLIEKSDHVLIFTGELGHYGGTLKTDCLPKIAEVKATNSAIEVGVDGGINDTNIKQVVDAGADVLNVGGFIQKAEDPQKAYDTLVSLAKGAEV